MPTSSARASPLAVNEERVLTKADFFVDVQLWPLNRALNPRGWLENFPPQEKEHAVNLLNAFLYFSSPLCDALLLGAFRSLSKYFDSRDAPFVTTQGLWQGFCDSVLIVHVEGENPSTTDSGYVFARASRKVLGIVEARIVSPQVALERLIQSGPLPVVFVDDFVGSGNQFTTGWHRRIQLSDGTEHSFDQLEKARGGKFFYCPLICTELGAESIHLECPKVVLEPAHLLSDNYNALSSNSHLWPDHLRPTAYDFIENASRRAGIPLGKWKGFQDLGLAIAFEHSVPDATLPLFHWEGNGWIPLIPRR
ncbi:phosphoribosyltransferase-like protein [Corallococcus llansteffanensis]|uniref:phosphoribosyltransferase-like protein n=1 Tax=Corallococcus llansteffanensis TaxID=2316731 RepID=UPI0011C42EB1|nr:hypothetical protein [Corallococcus llansteffanensis]